MNGTLAVASLSARLLAESAQRGGYRVVALDLFGDIDTRRAAADWMRIGEPITMRLDPDRTLAALHAFAKESNVVGWIAGSGFESMPDVLVHGSQFIRLIGNAPDTISRVRDPATFFSRLDALGVPHPPIAFTPPETPGDWLLKDAGGSGAWHIRPADAVRCPAKLPQGAYYQRRMPGRSLGALFIANGRDARIVGVSEQTIRARHGHPYVHCGIVGPVSLSSNVMGRLDDAVRAVVDDMKLVGLNSFDFLLDGDALNMLEVNARPSSSMALYDAQYEHGLVRAHVEAVCAGALPSGGLPVAVEPCGNEIVFAARRCRSTSQMVARQIDSRWCHDIAQPDTRFVAGEPVCTVSAQGRSLDEVRSLLDRRRDLVASWLEATND